MRTSLFELDRDGDTLYIVTFNQALANRLNRLTSYYADYTIRQGEEPLFKLHISKLDSFLNLLPLRMDKDYIRARIIDPSN